tara:strand:- start:606 stop:1157 length:552 start_codon:yes stop_codon:yes gene_type:complete
MVTIAEIITNFTTSSKEIGVNLITAIIIIVIGIFIGKFVKLILNRVTKKLKLEKVFKFGTVEVGLTIIKWTIYLFFIGVGIDKLNIPYLSISFANAISIIPKSVGALVILIGGFVLGKFLQNSIEHTGKKDWKLLGDISFYFFIYLSFIIAIQLIFAANAFLLNWTSVIFTAFFLLFLTLRNK